MIELRGVYRENEKRGKHLHNHLLVTLIYADDVSDTVREWCEYYHTPECATSRHLLGKYTLGYSAALAKLEPKPAKLFKPVNPAKPAKQDAKPAAKPPAAKPAKQDAKPMELEEATLIMAKQTREALQKSKANVIQDLSKYVKPGKEENVFKHLVHAQRANTKSKKMFHVKKTLNDWKDDNFCATYMQRYIHDATLHDVYIQHGLYFEREELRKKEKRKREIKVKFMENFKNHALSLKKSVPYKREEEKRNTSFQERLKQRTDGVGFLARNAGGISVIHVSPPPLKL